MSFNSVSFLIFFPTVTALYFLIAHRCRWLLLLIASCVFYAAFVPKYLIVLFALIAIDYTSALQIDRARDDRRRFWLIISICSTCSVLFFFKYWDFLDANIAGLCSWLGFSYSPHFISWALPIGLSFHTFQSLSYVIEVYRKKQKPERHLGLYALYVMFYPQLVAGPIERPGNLLPQFYEHHRFDYARLQKGLKMMGWGFFKKILVADQLATYVNWAYRDPQSRDGLSLALATLFFSIQIFADFSGYTNIARGAAEVMGFRLSINFNRPYLAESIGDFWRRWHISLSTWFRDYVYIPLGGNQVPPLRHAFNLFVTFLLSGLWHGANFTFLIWGALHAFYVIAGKAIPSTRSRITRIFNTYLLVCISWVFFRARNLSDAAIVFRRFGRVLTYSTHSLEAFRNFQANTLLFMREGGIWYFHAILLALAISAFLSIAKERTWEPHGMQRLAYYGGLCILFISSGLCMLLFLMSDFHHNQFLYFQF